MKLTPQREVFAGEIAKGKTQAYAYRVAFPSSLKWADKSVWSKASTLAADEKVRRRISDLREKVSRALDVTVERVTAERARMAFINLADLVDERGLPLNIKSLPEDIARGLAGVKWGKDGIEFKLDKSASLAALERTLGMYAIEDGPGRKAGVINIQINLGG